MPSILFALLLPLPAFLLAHRGRPLGWQIAATAAFALFAAALSEAWFWLARDSYQWSLQTLPAVPVDPSDMQSGHVYVGSASFGLARNGLLYASLATAALAQQRWHRLWAPRVAMALFWILLLGFVATALAGIPFELEIARHGAYVGAPLTEVSLALRSFVSVASDLAALALSAVLAIGLTRLVPLAIRWIRHAL